MKRARQGFAAQGNPIRIGLFFSSGCDIDAPFKALLDAAQNKIYSDDKQVVEAIVKVFRDPTPWMHIAFELNGSLEDSRVFELYMEYREKGESE